MTRRTVHLPDGSSTELTVFPTDDPAAPTVLCLPAMGVRADYYEILADTFVDSGYHVVLADHRGAGGSSVRASRRVTFGYREMLEMELPAVVDAVCAEFGAERIVIVGHSLGGQLGLLLAATSPRISHVVVVAAGSGWYRTVPGIRGVGRFLGLQLLFATTALWGHLPRWFPFAGREARGLMRDWGFEAMTGRYRVRHSAVDYEQALAASRVPALFIEFPDDPFVPAASAAHLAGKVTAAPVERREIPPQRFRLATTHHFRWVLRPMAVVDTVDDWLRRTPVGTDPKEADG